MTASAPDFRLARPTDVHAAALLRRAEPMSRFIAGGTDLLVNLSQGLGQPEILIDLSAIDELRELSVTEKGARIGAGVTLAALCDMPALGERYRALADAAVAVAGPTTRSLATVGGNLCLDTRCVYYNQSTWWRRANGFCLKRSGEVCHVAPQGKRCHAAFSGDLAPALLVLAARVEIAGPDRRRLVPLADLYADDGAAHLALADDELVVGVRLPQTPPPSRYEKARIRGAIDFPLAGAAVALAAEGGEITTLRVALTGTNAQPFLLDQTRSFVGRPLDEVSLQRLEKLVQQQVQPMRTTVVSAQYRRLAAAALARKLAAELYAQSGEQK
jgi:4-hydroxybenzoyl-CoA reductase subunit beta